LDLLKTLQTLPSLRNTRLVGGTGLALQLGHRISVDIDLFGAIQSPDEIAVDIRGAGLTYHIDNNSRSITQFTIDSVKVDCVNYPYPWLEEPVRDEDIVLANLKDIAAMKLSAITNRGTRRDFIDIYFLLNHFTLREQLDFYSQKYPDGSLFNVLRSLSYYADAENMPMPKMLIDIQWEKVKERINAEVTSICKKDANPLCPSAAP
jgi:hypothetical protein